MPRAEIIKIRLRHNRVEALYGILTQHVTLFEPATPHEHLLHEHLVALATRVHKMVAKERQERFTLNLTAVEALSFWQYFGECNLAWDPYADVIVKEMIAGIHKKHESTKRLRYAH
ncbi:MAG: hypothetical protein H0X33_12360 [Taibaiella sp.]|nr:hypothetical protein [Taibaiella sp.]